MKTYYQVIEECENKEGVIISLKIERVKIDIYHANGNDMTAIVSTDSGTGDISVSVKTLETMFDINVEEIIERENWAVISEEDAAGCSMKPPALLRQERVQILPEKKPIEQPGQHDGMEGVTEEIWEPIASEPIEVFSFEQQEGMREVEMDVDEDMDDVKDEDEAEDEADGGFFEEGCELVEADIDSLPEIDEDGNVIEVDDAELGIANGNRSWFSWFR